MKRAFGIPRGFLFFSSCCMMSAGVAEAEADIVIGGTVDRLDPMAVDLISVLPKMLPYIRNLAPRPRL
jgi:hypothetical protein